MQKLSSQEYQTEVPAPPSKAAMYVRVATDNQNSMENQANAIREYASRHNIEIIETYTDSGKSGLKLEGRDALKRLMDNVRAGHALFSMILLFDVSRWGRFQNADESSYYESLFRQAGINIQYVTEPFEDDDLAISGIIQSLNCAIGQRANKKHGFLILKRLNIFHYWN